MNVTKRIFALILALMLIISIAPAALAAPGGTIDMIGSETNTIEYTVYKMFDIIEASGGYKYKVSSDWIKFKAPGYFTYEETELDDNTSEYYVIWSKDTVSQADAAAVAQLAREYVEQENLTSDLKVSVAEDCGVTEDAYYLMVPSNTTVSGVVAVVGGERVEVNAKTEETEFPQVEKKVWEDSAQEYRYVNDVDIGQDLLFHTTIITGSNATNYVLHDIMDDHFAFDETSVSITRGGNTVSTTDYELVTECTDRCTFHIVFKENFLKSLNKDAKLVISYKAKLVSPVGNRAEVDFSHKNETWLTHTTNIETAHAFTETQTYNISVYKWDHENEDKRQPLAGAGFVLKDNIGKYYKWDEDNSVVMWVDDIEDADEKITSADNNYRVVFHGVDAEVFTLVEKTVPGGYVGTTDITVSTKDLSADREEPTKMVHSKYVDVVNVLGTALPETGGVGTTMFYVIGGLMVAAAAVLLVLKKRAV